MLAYILHIAYIMPRYNGIYLAYCNSYASIRGMYLAIARTVPTMLNGIRIMSIIHILNGIHTLSTTYMLNGIHSMTRVHTMTVVYSMTHVHVMNSVHCPSPWGG